MHLIKKLIFTIAILFSVQAYAITPHDLNNLVTDTSLTTKIKSKMVMDRDLSAIKVDISTTDGIVSLIGTLTEPQVRALIELVSETDGVKEIDTSKLTVSQNTHSLKDTVITAKVKGLYVRYKLFDQASSHASVDIATNNAVVYLTGTLDSQKQADKAIEIARSVNGVDKVNSQIQVN